MAVSLSKVVVFLLAVAAVSYCFRDRLHLKPIFDELDTEEVTPELARSDELRELDRLELMAKIEEDVTTFIPPAPVDLKRIPGIISHPIVPEVSQDEAAWDDISAELERLSNIHWEPTA